MKNLMKNPTGMAGFVTGIILTLVAGFGMQTIFSGAGLSDRAPTQTEVIYPNW